MKILIYHMRFHPDLTGTAPLVTQLAMDLAASGNSVTVIASLPHYGRNQVHPEYQHRSGVFHRSTYEGVSVVRTPVFVPKRPSLLARTMNYLSYTFYSAWAGLGEEAPDVVLAINPPITTAFSAWLAALRHRAPLVVGIQDVWPDVIALLGQLRNPVVLWFSKLLERLQYRLAKRVIVLSQGMKGNLLAKGVQEDKIVVVSNWADLERIRPRKTASGFRKLHGLEDRFVVLFAGNLGFVAALDSVLETARLLQSHPHILFLLVGEGNVKHALLEKSEKYHLENVRFLTTQPDEVLPEMLAAADIGLVVLHRALGDLSIPSKTYTLMAAGTAILAAVPENSAIADLLQKANCGIWIPPQDPASMAEALTSIAQEKDKLLEMGKNGRNYLEGNLSRKSQTNAYLSLLRDVVEKGGSRSSGAF